MYLPVRMRRLLTMDLGHPQSVAHRDMTKHLFDVLTTVICLGTCLETAIPKLEVLKQYELPVVASIEPERLRMLSTSDDNHYALVCRSKECSTDVDAYSKRLPRVVADPCAVISTVGSHVT